MEQMEALSRREIILSIIPSYFSCSYFYHHGCVLFCQLHLQMGMALVNCFEQHRRAVLDLSCITLLQEAPEPVPVIPADLSPHQPCSSEAASCLGFHSIFLSFGLQDYKPTSNPSSHSCFQRKKNTVKRSYPISRQFSKQKERLCSGQAS